MKRTNAARKAPKNALIGEVYERLHALHPDAHIELNFETPLDLLVATILSAQCTDARVNIVTAELFRRVRTVDDYLALPAGELERIIQSTGFFRQKAKSILGAAQRIRDEHGGRVPDEMELLVKLPGVGRKTANVVLGNAFHKPGMPVDTHVIRLSNRIGLTKQTDPVKIELELTAQLSAEHWTNFSHTMIFHGRRICAARKPACEKCTITDLCKYYRSINRP